MIATLARTEARGPSALETLPAALARLLDAEEACTYSIASRQEGLGVDQWSSLRADSERVRAKMDAVLRETPIAALPYNPLLPAMAERNVVLTLAELVRLDAQIAGAAVRKQLCQTIGTARSDGMRTLICDGPSMLAWVGAFRHRPFTESDRARLSALIVPLQRRLRLERRYDISRNAPEVLDVLLERVLVPALLCSEQGHVAAANRVARAALDAGELTREVLVGLVRDLAATRPFDVVQLGQPGLPRYYLVVGRSSPRAAARVTDLVRAWRLTPRERQVLEQLVLGASNKAIAAALGCAVKTVESHVSTVLQKAGVASRAELLARASGLE